MKKVLLLLVFVFPAFGQLNISSPFFVAGTLKPAAGGGGSETEFITSVTGGSDNSNAGLTGYQITVGGSGITVTKLGMLARADDTDNSKRVLIYASDCSTVLADTTVDISAHDGTYKYNAVSVSLSASTTYHIVFTNANSIAFKFNNTSISHSGAATIPQDVWSGTTGSCGTLLGTSDKICEGPNFKYQ